MDVLKIESALETARGHLTGTPYTVDACRHESVEEVTIWVFAQRRHQIGCMTERPTGWIVSHMCATGPSSQVTRETIGEGLLHITGRERGADRPRR